MSLLHNTWNRILDWFSDNKDRNRLIRDFNQSAKASFVMGESPTLLKATYSRGCSDYKHPYSTWLNSGFRITAHAGTRLTKDEMKFIGQVVLNNEELVRRLVVLGWDTLEVQDDVGAYGLRWNLAEYANIKLLS